MIRLAGRSVIAVVVLTVALGLVYPLVMTGFARVAFSHASNGSLVTRDGRVVGSTLVAQGFTSPRYFHERPSATTPPYNASATTFSNLGPTSSALAKDVRAAAQAALRLEGPYNPGLTVHDIPADAVTPSGSGVDPDISLAYARLQAARIAKVRGLSLDRVRQLIGQNTDGRSLGFLGEPGVNVLKLNLALDKATS